MSDGKWPMRPWSSASRTKAAGAYPGASMRLHCPYSKECHYRNVTKAVPDLSPKGGGGQEHGIRKAKRERHLYRVGQLGRIWRGLNCSNPSCAILRRFQVNAVRRKDAI